MYFSLFFAIILLFNVGGFITKNNEILDIKKYNLL